jgi:hypothetical protein
VVPPLQAHLRRLRRQVAVTLHLPSNNLAAWYHQTIFDSLVYPQENPALMIRAGLGILCALHEAVAYSQPVTPNQADDFVTERMRAIHIPGLPLAPNTYAFSWTPTKSDKYPLNLGAYGARWTPSYAWKLNAATITVN